MRATLILLFISFLGTSLYSQDTVVVYFDYNSFVLSSAELGKLQNQFSARQAADISIFGFTDPTGDAEKNVILAQNRNETIKKLIPANFSINNTTAIGEDNSNLSDAQKRRVEIIFPKEITQIVSAQSDILDKVPEPAPVATERKVELGVPIQLRIQFEPGSDVILSSSNSELLFLAKTLKDNPEFKVKLNGHVCCMNDMPLSIQRALRVKNYLIQVMGIDEARISSEGFSNSKPLVEELSEQDRIKNRRVEAIFSR